MSLLNSTQITRIRDLGTLRRGDIVEAHLRSEVHFRGRVEETAPGIGVVWIRDDSDGHRAILHADEYSIWQIRPALQEGTLAA
jgi:hypothetical protein